MNFPEYEWGAQDATARSSIGAPEVDDVSSNRHELFLQWQNFNSMLTHPDECFQSKYYRYSSGKSNVFDYMKFKESVHK